MCFYCAKFPGLCASKSDRVPSFDDCVPSFDDSVLRFVLNHKIKSASTAFKMKKNYVFFFELHGSDEQII